MYKYAMLDIEIYIVELEVSAATSTMNKFILLALALACISGSSAFVMKRVSFTRERCPPKPELVQNFDKSRYLGNWYQAEGIPAFFQPSSTSCVRATYGDLGDNKISVRNVGTYADEGFKEICGYAQSKDPENPGSLELNFPNTPKGNYWILDTDYENFSAVYSCTDYIGLVKFEYAWVLTRLPQAQAEVIEAARTVFVGKGISLDKFVEVEQTDACVYDNPDGTTCLD